MLVRLHSAHVRAYNATLCSRPVLHDAHVSQWLDLIRERLFRRSEIEGECWIWQGCLNNRGRDSGGGVPCMQLPNRGGSRPARRVAALVAGKTFRDNQVVVSTCDEPRCVNPDHMRVVSRSEAARLAIKRGTFKKGLPPSARRLAAARSKPHVIASMQLARAIRARYAEVGDALAVSKEFGIKHDHAHKIIRNKLWVEASPFAVMPKK